MIPMIVMLIFAGGNHGGPAIIQGFATEAACDAARPRVHEVYDRFLASAEITCVTLNSGAQGVVSQFDFRR
jgi:hypothetical protein